MSDAEAQFTAFVIVVGLLAWRFAREREQEGKRRRAKEPVVELREEDHLAGASEV